MVWSAEEDDIPLMPTYYLDLEARIAVQEFVENWMSEKEYPLIRRRRRARQDPILMTDSDWDEMEADAASLSRQEPLALAWSSREDSDDEWSDGDGPTSTNAHHGLKVESVFLDVNENQASRRTQGTDTASSAWRT
jgi:hypothetical protein